LSSRDPGTADTSSGGAVAIDVAANLQVATPGAVEAAVMASVAGICQTLRLPATACTVTATINAALTQGSIECTVNGRVCRYDPQAETILKDYVGGDPSDPTTETDYIALLVRHALTLQPAVLLDEGMLDAWRVHLPAAVSRDDASVLLAGLLDARLPADDYAAIASHVAPEKAIGEVLEDCLAAFSATRVTVRVAQSYYDQVCADRAVDLTAVFEEMRLALFEGLGLLCPYIAIEPGAELRGRGFAVVMNALAGTPRCGIAADHVYVNDTPDRLRLMNLEGSRCLAPNLGAPGAVVDAASDETLTAIGLTVLRPLVYMAAAVREEIERHAALLVHQVALEMYRAATGALFPALADAARDAVPIWRLTAAVRELARDRVPLRSFPVLLERVVDFPFNAHAPNRYSIGDDRISSDVMVTPADDLVAFLRTGLAREIAWAVSQQTGTVVAFLADERKLAPLHQPDGTSVEETIGGLVRSVEEEMASRSATAPVRSLLARPETARRIRPHLRFRFPRLAVLSHADLPSDVNVQPVARVG
jgi:hypothetical protein